MQFGSFAWEKVGPRRDERVLAGRVAGILWLTVLPMVFVAILLPGSDFSTPGYLALLTLPPLIWGVACLLIPWQRVPTPLFFHVPASLALPYIGVLIAMTGAEHSPFSLTLLMLITFSAYFFTPAAAVPYLISSLVVMAFPLLYHPHSLHDSELTSRVWIALFVFGAVGGVIMVGKRQLLSLRDAATELSRRDSLTGLANRRALTEVLAMHGGGERQSDSLGMLLIDLDDFKEANTLHGLPGGDRVLMAVADALRGLSRSEDMVVRLGGDEFAVLGSQFDQEGMRLLAQRALERIREACDALELPGIRVTASAGWALYPDDVSSLDQIVTAADLSLRAAKAEGKSRYHEPVPMLVEHAS
jgi:diguanylate cyclase (GGDEF)-like protein